MSTPKGSVHPITGKDAMTDIYKHIGDKIRQLRTSFGRKGISQDDLAAKMGTTANTISRWETATYKPSIMELEKLARFFGVPITAFFPPAQVTPQVNALLSATGDLDDEDLEEVTRYAQFRKARAELKKAKRRA
jgi:transcriptional regulator with XRE-family HTH domain